uniref:Uncharacterized protein n=1 Tax=Eutreptiella gymnastica TaxID=73025 RepID=A0A7S4FXR9_9EUGL|mmetsp:Transcript_57900/g.95902  ORF Transcript_57900/g.95902 Transcript_57900/m.95902 type:complete len:101 (-) Transcript_57900:51-353(-)
MHANTKLQTQYREKETDTEQEEEEEEEENSSHSGCRMGWGPASSHAGCRLEPPYRPSSVCGTAALPGLRVVAGRSKGTMRVYGERTLEGRAGTKSGGAGG